MSTKNIIIIEGPSGVGKDTIIDQLISRFPDRFDRPINATTREMRENESQGHPYLFLTEEEFKNLRKSGEIFEETIRHGTYRGMRKSSFNEIINAGKIALRDCDKYGLEALKKEYPDQVIGIFLTCDKNNIRKRLEGRNEPIESMEIRLADYENHIKDAYYFDYVIENNDIESTLKQILDIINTNN
ncbi:MAG: guanylate kinase [Christensenellales bacterium]